MGKIPAGVQTITPYAAGLATGARHPEAARALIRYMTGPDAAPVLRTMGLEPAGP